MLREFKKNYETTSLVLEVDKWLFDITKGESQFAIAAMAQASKAFQEALRETYEPDWPGVEHVKAMSQVNKLHGSLLRPQQ